MRRIDGLTSDPTDPIRVVEEEENGTNGSTKQ